MKIILNGANGKMGKQVVNEIVAQYGQSALVAAVDITLPSANCPCYTSLSQVEQEADVLIDFSHHSATQEVIAFAKKRRMAVVIATTGQTEHEKELIAQAASEIPVFLSGNMSIGIALLAQLCKMAVQAFPQADVEIIETHHNQKLDVPSGTALMLAQGIRTVKTNASLCVGRHENGKRPTGEVGIHSVRGGAVVGIHEVRIFAGAQTITLKHEAHDRALFAQGALSAATFLCTQNAGLYHIEDLFA